MRMYFIANVKMPTDKAHGIQLIKMCEAFLMKGADLELWVPRFDGSTEDIKDFYGLRLSVPVKKIFALNVYHFGRQGFILGSISFAISYFFVLLLKRLSGERFIVYTVDLDHFAFLPLAFLPLPYFIEIHGEKKKTFLHSYFFQQASGIIAINDFLKQNLMENYNLAPAQILVQPNGIDLEKFSLNFSKAAIRKKLGLPLDKRLILYVGRLYRWKGFDTLFFSAKNFPEDFLLCFLGATSEEARAFAPESQIPQSLVFCGGKDYKEIPLWLAAADAFLLLGTSQNQASYYYTSPMKLFEYMAGNRPIVASRTPANEDVVSEKEVFFYEPDNAEDLTRQIGAVFQNPNLAQARVSAAFHKVKELSWQKRASRILSFISNNIE